jgi:hypothetical protein
LCVGGIISIPWLSKELKTTYRRTTGFAASSLLGVIIFCSVQFLPEKTTKLKKKRPETEPEPAQTGRFWFGFGPVFWIKYWTNLYAFFGLFNGLLMDFCWAYN